MKISYNWLQEYINIDLSIEDISGLLTSIGLEVESVDLYESIPGGLANLYIGKVLSCYQHPNADKLKCTEVDLGPKLGVRKIVCGAPNVAEGQVVVVAIEGAQVAIPSGDRITIKNTKIRGEESQGMICAEDEIGIGKSHDGILVLEEKHQIGQSASEIFEVYHDTIFEIGLTPNRTDANSHYGVARDIAAVCEVRGITYRFHNISDTTIAETQRSIQNEYSVVINSSECSSFYITEIQGINSLKTPSYIKNRLHAIGEQSRNIIVDVTNYILHDIGQPMHAYDMRKLSSKEFSVRNSEEKVEFKALNQAEYKVENGDLLIMNGTSISGLAGIIGSQDTAIDEQTTSIVLECAEFYSKRIRTTSQRIQFRSEAASKFEKGIDPQMTSIAMKKSLAILTAELPMIKVSNTIFSGEASSNGWTAKLPQSLLETYAHRSFDSENLQRIFAAMGMLDVTMENGNWEMTVPSYKHDVKRQEDLIEEVMRIQGFDTIPYPKHLRTSLSFSNGLTKNSIEERIAKFLVNNGYSEIMTNSISQSKFYPDKNVVRLLNSMTSELDVLRPEILPGIMEVLEHNLNRDQKSLRLFEFGHTYHIVEGSAYSQRRKLAMVQTGYQKEPNWDLVKGLPASYFTMKESIDFLAQSMGFNVYFEQYEVQGLEHSMRILSGDIHLGHIGIINAAPYGIKQSVYGAELEIERIFDILNHSKPKFAELPKFPAVYRDLALLIDLGVSFEDIKVKCYQALGKDLKDVMLFDIYQDKSLGENKKSYAIRICIQDIEKTMLDKEIEQKMKRLISTLASDLGATVRSS